MSNDKEFRFDICCIESSQCAVSDVMVYTGMVSADYLTSWHDRSPDITHCILIYTDDPDPIPHFHLYRLGRDRKGAVAGIRDTRILIDSADYYSPDDMRITCDEARALHTFLETKYHRQPESGEMYGVPDIIERLTDTMTIWNWIAKQWDRGEKNKRKTCAQSNQSREMPDYYHDLYWDEEKKRRLLRLSKELLEAYWSGYLEALKAADDLEQRIRSGDDFLQDYEIEMRLSVLSYDDEEHLDEDNRLLDESIDYEDTDIRFDISHCHYRCSHPKSPDDVPIGLDHVYFGNWNREYFGAKFRNEVISYPVHALIDHGNGAKRGVDLYKKFDYILNISGIWTDVEVCHQNERRLSIK
jgi:hypothetical protein